MMMPVKKGPESRYPLHYLVWHNKYRELEKELSDKQEQLEQVDPRGRTPLHLATTLGHIECARVLLNHGADVSKENRSGWTDTSAVVMEIDHDRHVVFSETLSLGSQDHEVLLAAVQPTEEQAMSRLTAPVVTTQLDTKNIAFERNKSGILGWRSEKTEVINGYESKVYGASNVELITRTRTEHLSDQHKSKSKGSKTPLQSFLGIAEQHVGPNNGQTLITQTFSQTNPTSITPDEYFDPNFDLGNRDMGRPMELTTKTQKFKAKLWLCEDHPLSLSEQVAPIIDLMAISNALFAKLRDFITLRLPPGFPVKIEIPIFHILNARITFGNLNGCDEPVSSLRQSPSSEAPSPSSDSCSVSSTSSITSGRGCDMDQSLFEAPRGYSVVGSYRESMREEEDDLLQFAIQQSLLEAGSEYDQVTIWEALTNSKPGTHPMSNDSRRGERTAQHNQPSSPPHTGSNNVFTTYQEQLRLAMELSAKEQEEEIKLKQQEEEELERILQLSLTEK
ncbi:ankyrin repeat domain-containing 13B [Pelobates cultripes]|uniref:Ankyrin repeat domain-containing 13B n=1 Tax=Pelobates cultripes TaxID=61616 RepID=A0AAD1VLW1_PELCU|nr:ankyrin repeat domain-containing 13B [Pelobates cultripes]